MECPHTLKLTSICPNKRNPKETTGKTINLIPRKTQIHLQFTKVSQLLMSILFKLSHIYYGCLFMETKILNFSYGVFVFREKITNNYNDDNNNNNKEHI